MRYIRQSLKVFAKIGSNLKLDMKCRVSTIVQNCCSNSVYVRNSIKFPQSCRKDIMKIVNLEVSWKIIISSKYLHWNCFALSNVWYAFTAYLHLVRYPMAWGQNCPCEYFHLKRLGLSPLNKCKGKGWNVLN